MSPAQESAEQALTAAAEAIVLLRLQVDPGHIPMIKYLRALESDLRYMQLYLHKRCDQESGR